MKSLLQRKPPNITLHLNTKFYTERLNNFHYPPLATRSKPLATFNFGPLASEYITPYFYRGGINVAREYGMRKNADGKFRFGNSEIEIENHSNIVIENKKF
jgi:hypothetical protein